MSQIGWIVERFLLERIEDLPRFQQKEQKLDFEVKMVVEKILTQKPSQSIDCSGWAKSDLRPENNKNQAEWHRSQESCIYWTEILQAMILSQK